MPTNDGPLMRTPKTSGGKKRDDGLIDAALHSPSRDHLSPKGKVSPNGSRTGVDGSELNNQAYAWIDTNRQPCSPPPEEDTVSVFSQNFLPERKTTLLVSDDIHLGLLIRGGIEYGLGIYVTGLDKASAAEAGNLKVSNLR